MRAKSFWGWGWAEAFPDEETRKGLGEMVKAQLGVEPELLPLPIERAIDLPSARKEAPGHLQVTCERGARIAHTYGRAYGDLIRGFRGDFANAPDLVAFPENEDHIRAILDWCDSERIAVVPYGGGTSVVRGVECPRDRAECVLSLDLTRLDRVLEIDHTSRLARIQAGATGPKLEAALAQEGMTLRCYPQSFEFSTLGGWIATRAGGHFATLYTHVDDLVASTRTITPKGTIETRLLPASGAGPSPDRLILGSEGTLGVITEAWMRIRPRPKWKLSASARFAEFSAAVRAARQLAQSGLHPSNCRLLDPAEAALNGVVMDGSSVLLIAFESDDHPLDAWMTRALEICESEGGTHDGPRDRSQEGESWKAAFVHAPYLQSQLVSLGILADTFETACTWSRFEALHAALSENVMQALLRTGGSGKLTCRFTHVYPDGPAPYYTFVTKAKSGGELEQWAEIKQAASDTLLAHGATITHHHAVGRTHRPWYDRQIPALLREILRSAKRTVDPQGLMNPGVLVDP